MIPLAGAEEQVLEHVPRDVTLTVTASPVKGLDHTLELAGKLAAHGLSGGAAPLRPARRRPFAPGRAGGADRRSWACATSSSSPAMPISRQGRSSGAAELLDAMAEVGHPFEQIGITGYPESHPIIDDETTIAAMFEKARHATYIASQICFDSRVTVAWIDNVWTRGTRLPILVGIPGIVPRAKLLRVSTRIGIGESLRYLRKHGDFVTRFLQPGGFNPDKLIKGLAPALATPEQRVGGFHIFTFNDLADTEAWRQRKLAGG